jgi:hypothetical protein
MAATRKLPPLPPPNVPILEADGKTLTKEYRAFFIALLAAMVELQTLL